MKKSFFILFFCGLIFTGCSLLKLYPQAWPECNQNISNESLLKKIADDHETCLESIGNDLIISNALAIGFDMYTREEARNAVNRWIAILDTDISYKGFRKEVYDVLKKYPGMFEVADIYFMQFENFGLNPIIQDDKDMLKDWLITRVLPPLQEIE